MFGKTDSLNFDEDKILSRKLGIITVCDDSKIENNSIVDMSVLTKDVKNIYKTVNKIANQMKIVVERKIEEEEPKKEKQYTKQETKEEYSRIEEIDENHELYKYLNNSDNSIENKKTAEYNENLLNIVGVAENGNSEFLNTLIKVGGILVLITIIISIIMLYTSFKITSEERIKELGVLTSIGCSKKQKNSITRKEAIILGTIGITLGLTIGIILSKVMINIIDILLRNCIYDTTTIKYIANRASFYIKIPFTSIITSISIIYFVIFMASQISVKKINKISIIESIRKSDNTKIEKKQMAVPNIIRKKLGIIGILAYKNIKRNKSKYKSILISLVINIILVLSILGGIDNYYNTGIQGALLEISESDMIGDYGFITYDMKNTKKLIQYLMENNLIYEHSVYECLDVTEKVEITDNVDEYLNSSNKVFELNLKTDKIEEIEKNISKIEDILERQNFNK